jgi:hypothetical protein
MYEPQSPQTSPAPTAFGKFFDVDRFGIPHHDRQYFSVSIDEQSELAPDFKRKVGEISG